MARNLTTGRGLDGNASLGRNAPLPPVVDVLRAHAKPARKLGGGADGQNGAVDSSHAANYNMAFRLLSTQCSPWNNGNAGCDHKQMVDPNSKPKTQTELRLDAVRKATGCTVKSRFAEWIGAESPQAVGRWETRDRITADGAVMISRVTGADTHWLLTGEGEAFPRGPTVFKDHKTAGDSRLKDLEAHVDALSGALAKLVAVVSRRIPGAGPEIAEALRSLAVDPSSLLPELAVVVTAAESVRGSAAPAGRADARSESSGKPPRKGR